MTDEPTPFAIDVTRLRARPKDGSAAALDAADRRGAAG